MLQLIVTANYSGPLKPETLNTIEISVRAILKAYGFTETTVSGAPASRQVDPKHSAALIDGKIEVLNKTGEPVPEDEPMMLFRGRDMLAMHIVWLYLGVAQRARCNTEHLRGITERSEAFTSFSLQHADRMKRPGD